MSVQFKPEYHYDTNEKRQYLNGKAIVFHCHHYICLFTQLADDAKLFNGEQLLRETAEETFYQLLTDYAAHNCDVKTTDDRRSIAEQYFAFVGLGALTLSITESGGSASMPYSHVDEGWIKKWGTREQAVNFVGQGYIAAACAFINNLPCASYQAQETQSKVAGAAGSTFAIERI